MSISKRRYTIYLGMALVAMLLSCMAMGQQGPPAPRAADTSRTDLIQIIRSGYGEYIQRDTVAVHKLVGDVKLLHGSDTLYCDSAFLYKNRNSVEAFGNVEIAQADGTQAFADYMRYTGYNKTVYMKGGVSLISKADQLWSEQLDYNLATKIGKYYNGGTLQTETTTLESRSGIYNVKTRDARFTGNVYVQDPDYTTVSQDLGYNTESKVAVFFAPSTVQNDKSTLHSSNGYYDTKNKVAHFVDRSAMLNESQYIEADTLDYDRNIGFAKAKGRVIALDTAQNITLYAGYAQYNEQNGKMLAVERPLMKIVNGSDSLFMKADTFFSEPVENLPKKDTLDAADSLQMTLNALRAAAARGELADSAQLDSLQALYDSLNVIQAGDSLSADSLLDPMSADSLSDAGSMIMDENFSISVADSVTMPADTAKQQLTSVDTAQVNSHDSSVTVIETPPPIPDSITVVTTEQTAAPGNEFSRPATAAPATDTSKPRYFIGYHHVVIYSDSMQGKCDSLSYSRADSMMRMYYNPVLWSRNGQILGDTIYTKMDSSKIEWLYVPRNGIMINRNGPEKAGMFDQLQGNKLWAYFTKNKIDSMMAMPNAESIYFLQDESDAYLGSSQAKSEKIEIHFDTTGSGQKIKRVYYRKDVEQTMTPMKEVTPSSLRLSRFAWKENERPKSLEEFLKGTAQQVESEWMQEDCEEEEAPVTDSIQEKKTPPADTVDAVPSFKDIINTGNTRRDADKVPASGAVGQPETGIKEPVPADND